MKKEFKPKCLQTEKSLAITATGYVVPCCWVDNEQGWTDKILSKFYDKSLHLDNNKNIEDIVNSEIWYDFFSTLINKPKNAPNSCKKFCSTGLDESITRKTKDD